VIDGGGAAGAAVSARDLAHNYFVTAADAAAGRPRAQAVLSALLEMNGDCRGEWRAEAPAALMAREPDFLRRGGFSLVIACQMPQQELAALALQLEGSGVPLMVRAGAAAPAAHLWRRTCAVRQPLPPPLLPRPRRPCARPACSRRCACTPRSTTSWSSSRRALCWTCA